MSLPCSPPNRRPRFLTSNPNASPTGSPSTLPLGEVSILEKLVTLATYRDDQRPPIRERTELSSHSAEVHIDAPVIPHERFSERALGQFHLAVRSARMPEYNLEQTELSA